MRTIYLRRAARGRSLEKKSLQRVATFLAWKGIWSFGRRSDLVIRISDLRLRFRWCIGWRLKKSLCFGRFVFRHLHQDATCSHRVPVQAQRRKFMHHHRVELGGVESRTDELGVRRVEGAR